MQACAQSLPPVIVRVKRAGVCTGAFAGKPAPSRDNVASLRGSAKQPT